jgi:hypothetical protein
MGRPLIERTRRPRRTITPIANVKKHLVEENRPSLVSELNNLKLTIKKVPAAPKCNCQCKCKEPGCQNCCGVCKSKRITYRYSRLCIYCCRMVRGQNYTRHIRKLHPGGMDTSFVTCLVPAQHLVQMDKTVAANSVDLQTITEVPENNKENIGGMVMDFQLFASQVLSRATSACLTCQFNQEYADFFPPNTHPNAHLQGCNAPPDVLIPRHLPAVLNELSIFNTYQHVLATQQVAQILSASYYGSPSQQPLLQMQSIAPSKSDAGLIFAPALPLVDSSNNQNINQNVEPENPEFRFLCL